MWLLLEQGASESKVTISPLLLYSSATGGFGTSIISSSILFFFALHIIHWKWVNKRKWSWWQKRLSFLLSLLVATVYYCLIVFAVVFHSIESFASLKAYTCVIFTGPHHAHDDLKWRILLFFFFFFNFLGFFYRGLARWAGIVGNLWNSSCPSSKKM